MGHFFFYFLKYLFIFWLNLKKKIFILDTNMKSREINIYSFSIFIVLFCLGSITENSFHKYKILNEFIKKQKNSSS